MGYVCDSEWRAPVSTGAFEFHGRVMDIDATLLGSGPPITSGNIRGIRCSGWLVSPLSMVIVHPLS